MYIGKFMGMTELQIVHISPIENKVFIKGWNCCATFSFLQTKIIRQKNNNYSSLWNRPSTRWHFQPKHTPQLYEMPLPVSFHPPFL